MRARKSNIGLDELLEGNDNFFHRVTPGCEADKPKSPSALKIQTGTAKNDYIFIFRWPRECKPTLLCATIRRGGTYSPVENEDGYAKYSWDIDEFTRDGGYNPAVIEEGIEKIRAKMGELDVRFSLSAFLALEECVPPGGKFVFIREGNNPRESVIAMFPHAFPGIPIAENGRCRYCDSALTEKQHALDKQFAVARA